MLLRRYLRLHSKARLKDVQMVWRRSVEPQHKVLKKILCLLRKHLTEVFCWLCQKVSDALGMLPVWRAAYWVLLVWLAMKEWLMKLIMEE